MDSGEGYPFPRSRVKIAVLRLSGFHISRNMCYHRLESIYVPNATFLPHIKFPLEFFIILLFQALQ